MSVREEAVNTKKMREHLLTKRPEVVNKHEEIDLGITSTVVDIVTSRALNARTDYASISDIIGTNENDALVLVSDADEQLILNIVFKDPVTITAVKLGAENCPDVEGASRPKVVKFYANHDDLDFREAEDLFPSQVVESIDQQVVMKGTKFQKVNSIQIFIESNEAGSDVTFLSRLSLKGFINPPYAQQHMR